MTLETVGSAIGAGLAAAGLVIAGARRWMSKPAEQKLDNLSRDLGVGTVGPSVADLVMSTATAVQRLEATSTHNGTGINEILRVQKIHGDRISRVETKHEALDARVTLAMHTDRIAELLAGQTDAISQAIASRTDTLARAIVIAEGKACDPDACAIVRGEPVDEAES